MSEVTVSISFAVDSHPVRLSSPGQWRHAIEQGDLSADTSIIVEQDGETIFVGAAIDAPQLEGLFPTPDPLPADEIEAPVEPTTTDDQSTQPNDHTSSDDEERRQQGVSGTADRSESSAPGAHKSDGPTSRRPASGSDGPATRSPVEPKESEPEHDSKWQLSPPPVIIGIIILLVLIIMVRCAGGGGSQGPVETSASVTQYAALGANLRSEPSRDGDRVGQLDRGNQIEGSWVESEGERWFRIDEGRHAGAYVWAGNLLGERPPDLTGPSRTRTTINAVTMRSAPYTSAGAIQNIAAGATVDVRGETRSGWWEIAMEGVGVGYLPPAAFEQVVAETPANDEPQNDQTTPEPLNCRTTEVLRGDGEYEQTYCYIDGGWRAQGSAQRIGPRRPASTPPPAPPQETQRPNVPPRAPITPQPQPRPTPPPEPAAPAAPTAPDALISRPVWIEQPTPTVFNDVMPRRALDRGRGGVVGLECRVSSSGRLTNCNTRSETPSGWGFENAARRTIPHFRMGPTDGDGQPTAGRRVRLNINFEIE